MSVKILAIGAHPDDIELGVGGCLAKYDEEGVDVYCLILSRGEKGVSDDLLEDREKLDILKGELRENETKNALKLLGIKEENIKILGLPDTGIKIDENVVEEVYKHIMKINPDMIYTHHFEDDHLDHVSTSLISLHAARKIKTILLYESPSTRAFFSPNYFVDISAYIQKKEEALKLHKTQAKKPHMDDDVIISKARFRGFQAKVDYAEAFVVHRMVIE